MRRIDFLGCPVDSLTMQEALERAGSYIRERRCHHIVPINAAKLWRMQREPRLAKILLDADLVVAERAIDLGAAFLGTPLRGHIGGSLLAMALLPFAAQRGYSIFFLGARPQVLEQLVRRVHHDYPELKVAGWQHGYFSPGEEQRLVCRIRESKPDILLVAMGSPQQEYWIREHLSRLGVPVCIGVGGTFDVLAGVKKDAPQWVRKCAMEWFYRLLQDPRNLWKRYLTTIPWFLVQVLREKVSGRKPAVLSSSET